MAYMLSSRYAKMHTIEMGRKKQMILDALHRGLKSKSDDRDTKLISEPIGQNDTKRVFFFLKLVHSPNVYFCILKKKDNVQCTLCIEVEFDQE